MEADTERQMQQMKTKNRESATTSFQMYQQTLQGNRIEKWRWRVVELNRKYLNTTENQSSSVFKGLD